MVGVSSRERIEFYFKIIKLPKNKRNLFHMTSPIFEDVSWKTKKKKTKCFCR